MTFEIRCACGKVLRTVSTPAGVPADRVLANYQAKARKDSLTMFCACGRVNTAAPSKDCKRRGQCHAADVVLRGEGGVDAGRGSYGELARLHAAHVARGGRYDPPKPRKPVVRGDPPGTVRIETHDGPVKVLPGRVQVVGGLLVDTTGKAPTVSPVGATGRQGAKE